jgi:hypothetical protein
MKTFLLFAPSRAMDAGWLFEPSRAIMGGASRPSVSWVMAAI